MRMKVLAALLVIALMLSGMPLTAKAASSSSANDKKFDGIYRVEINNDLIDGGDASSTEDDDDDDYGDEVVAIDDYDDEEDVKEKGTGERVILNENSIKFYGDDLSIEASNVHGRQVIWEAMNVSDGTTITEKDYGFHTFKDIYKNGRAVVKVRAHFVEGNTDWSTSAYVVPFATFDSMKKSYVKKNKIKLTWDEVQGAAGYEVWLASNFNKNFKKIATTESTSKIFKMNMKAKSRQFFVKAIYEDETASEKSGYDWYSVRVI